MVVRKSYRCERIGAVEKSVGLILYREAPEGRLLLLLHYLDGHWDFAKGHVKKGESEKETAARELCEETGITHCSIHDGFRGRVQYSFKRKKKTVAKEVVYYIARTDTDSVTLSDEHRGCEWLNADAARGRLTFENSRRVLQDALAVIEGE
jgi:bis(5'-nucleosidyl)-tetraphosphatase